MFTAAGDGATAMSLAVNLACLGRMLATFLDGYKSRVISCVTELEQ